MAEDSICTCVHVMLSDASQKATQQTENSTSYIANVTYAILFSCHTRVPTMS